MTTCPEYYMEINDNRDKRVQWNCKDSNKLYSW